MKDHLEEKTIARYVDGELPADHRDQVRQHMRRCPACREALHAATALADTLRTALAPGRAPEALLHRIEADLAAAGAGGRVPAHRWRSYGMGALAASLLLVLLLPAMATPRLGEAFIGVRADHARAHPARGSLVCLGCARRAGGEAGKRCGGGGAAHATGLATDDGRYWSIVASPAARPLMDDPSLRGRQVSGEARFFPSLGYVDFSEVGLL